MRVFPYVTSYNKEITKQNTGEEVLTAIHKDLEEASVLLEKYDPWSTAKKMKLTFCRMMINFTRIG
ncbi:MAG: hypothetical protein ACLTZT_11125 [Butyricimonas faecalis]